MAIFVPSFLRPLSDARTGMQSYIDEKTEVVEEIRAPSNDLLSFQQSNPVNLWVNEQANRGRTRVTSNRKIRVEKEVEYPDRHWWVISEGLLENLERPLRDHADIFDFLLALNLSTEDPVFFSQNPGQVLAGAYDYERGALNFKDDLSMGSISTTLLHMNEIPEVIEISREVEPIFLDVRKYRSQEVGSDKQADIRIALHMYDDALSSDIWTASANLFFVCENILEEGKFSSRIDQRISETTNLDLDEVKNWRNMVNRLKHPDKGDDVQGLLDKQDLKIPTLRRMRSAANAVLRKEMAEIE